MTFPLFCPVKLYFLSNSIEKINQLTTVVLGSNRLTWLKEFKKHHTLHIPPDTQKDVLASMLLAVRGLPMNVCIYDCFLLALSGKQRDAWIKLAANAVSGEFMRYSFSDHPNLLHLMQSSPVPRVILGSATDLYLIMISKHQSSPFVASQSVIMLICMLQQHSFLAGTREETISGEVFTAVDTIECFPYKCDFPRQLCMRPATKYQDRDSNICKDLPNECITAANGGASLGQPKLVLTTFPTMSERKSNQATSESITLLPAGYKVKQIADVVRCSRKAIIQLPRHQEEYATKKSSGQFGKLDGCKKSQFRGQRQITRSAPMKSVRLVE
uniref:Rho-GAP domain-containing protein n=1 Tax=Heterorhabditis bacteriophora TaxID=37862 RepID=A0A1I7X1N6_HETBA